MLSASTDEGMGPFQTLVDGDDPLSITTVTVEVAGESFVLRSQSNVIHIPPGENLQVVGVDYRLKSGETLSGKVAFEGYLRHVTTSGDPAGETFFDYGDSRQGKSVQSGDIPAGESSHPGLDSGWAIETGTDQLLISMVRYGGTGPVIEDRVRFDIQVGEVDIELKDVSIDPSGRYALVGEQIRLFGQWRNLNEQGGLIRDYAEVDIFHSSDLQTPVWVGSFTHVIEAKGFASGEFTQRYGKFDEFWTPDRAGTYVLRFSADPEDRFAEVDEDNNRIVVELTVFSSEDEAKGKL